MVTLPVDKGHAWLREQVQIRFRQYCVAVLTICGHLVEGECFT